MTGNAFAPLRCDSLTGALTRHSFDALLRRILTEAATSSASTALLMIDIDHFKSINDSFGHTRGDAVLVEVVQRLNAALRDGDQLFRFGGDEFVLLLPLANRFQARRIGERLLETVRHTPFAGDPPLHLTLSIGVAAFPQDATTPEALFAVADRRVYQAKQAGRGRVAAADAPIRPIPKAAPERLIERDEALATLRAFLDTSDSDPRILCLHAPPASGRTRLLAELERGAAARGYATFAVRGSLALRARRSGALSEAAQELALPPVTGSIQHFAAELARTRNADRLLITIDDPQNIDSASLDALRELVVAEALPPLRLAYVHGPAWARRPLLDTTPHFVVVLPPLTTQGLAVWLRQALRWEPPTSLIAWVNAYSAGLPGRIRGALDTLIAHGALVSRDGGWHWKASLATGIVPGSAKTPALIRMLASAPLMVGRDEEVVLLRTLIADERLVSIVGQGGVGKSRLALQVAAESSEAFRDGAYFVPLAGVEAIAHIPAAIAAALQLPSGGNADLQSRLMAYLSSREVLLVLDNVEHLRDGAQFLMELLRGAPGLRLVVTSRERLDLPDEHVIVLEGLALPTASAESEGAAVQLFLQQARQAYPAFAPDDSDLRAIRQICRLLQGLPLGIELAAAGVCSTSCPAISAELEHNLAVLTSTCSELPIRHRSMTAVLDSFWELLSLHEQRAVQALAVFRGGFTRDAARQVAGASPFLLDGLLAKTFLRRTAQGRFVFHELLRQYAAEQLRTSSHTEARVCDRHSTYYLHLLTEAYPKPDAAHSNLDEMRSELDNIRAAWLWAVDHMRVERLDAALNAFAALMINTGQLREGLEIVDAALARLNAAAPTSRSLPAHLLAIRALLLFYLGNLPETLMAGRQAEGLLIGQQIPLVAARVHLSTGMALLNMGELESARIHLEQALALASSDERLAIRALDQLGEHAYSAGNAAASNRYAIEAIRRAHAGGYEQDELRGLVCLGMGQLFLEQHAEAGATFEQVLAHPATPRQVLIETFAYGWLSQVRWDVQEYVRSTEAVERALWLSQQSNMRRLDGLSLRVLGLIALVSGDFARAEEQFAGALAIFEQLAAWRDFARIHTEWALLAQRCGAHEVALTRGNTALEMIRERRYPMIAGHALIHRGHALLALDQPQAAAEAYQQGREQLLTFGKRNRAAEALAGLALAELALGRRDPACAHGHTLLAHLNGGAAALGGMYDPAWVCLAAYDVLCADDPQGAAAALAHGHAVFERIIAQFSPEQVEQCVANTPSLRRISMMRHTDQQPSLLRGEQPA